MTGHTFDEQRLREFEEYQARVTRFATHEQFNQFCSENLVVFPQGMEYQIAQTCKVLNSVTYKQLGYLQLEHRRDYVGSGIG